DVDADRHGGDPVYVVAHHHIDQRVGEAVAMLDGVDAGPERRGDAVGADGVRGHHAAQAVRLVHNCLRFGVGEIDPAVQHAVGREVVAAVAVILDPVSAV